MPKKNDGLEKVSPALAATLADLPATAIVRVVVLLDVPTRASPTRLSLGERAQAIAAVRSAMSELLEQLKPTLEAAGACRVDVGGMLPIGSIVLDVPAGGVARLAGADQVRLILADQPLTNPEGKVVGNRV